MFRPEIKKNGNYWLWAHSATWEKQRIWLASERAHVTQEQVCVRVQACREIFVCEADVLSLPKLVILVIKPKEKDAKICMLSLFKDSWEKQQCIHQLYDTPLVQLNIWISTEFKKINLDHQLLVWKIFNKFHQWSSIRCFGVFPCTLYNWLKAFFKSGQTLKLRITWKTVLFQNITCACWIYKYVVGPI